MIPIIVSVAAGCVGYWGAFLSGWSSVSAAGALLVGLLLLQRAFRKPSGVEFLPEAREAIDVFNQKREHGLVELVQAHGKNFRMHLDGSAKAVAGGSVVFATADPTVVRSVLMDRVHSVKRPSRYFLARFLPYMDGVLFMHGKIWRKHTETILPVFAPSNFERFVAAMHHATVTRMAAAFKRDGQNPVDMLPLAKDIGLDNLLVAGFGVDLAHERGQALRLAMHNYLAVDEARDDKLAPLARFFKTMWRLYTQGTVVNKTLKALLAAGPSARIALAADGSKFKPSSTQIDAARALVSSSGTAADQSGTAAADAMTVTDLCGGDDMGKDATAKGSTHVNFLDRMVGAGFSAKEIAGEVNHINGAHKAFAVELTFSLYELARAPEIAQRVREELEAVLTATGRAFPTRDDLPQLQYCQAVFREVLRMHCISMGIIRELAAPLTLPKDDKAVAGRDIVLPSGTTVLMLMHAVHHLPEFWDAPNEFRPERWLKANGKLRSGPRVKFSYFPFLEGPRQCQGRFLVVLEWLVVVNAILHNYNISLPDGYKMVKKADFYPIPEVDITIALAPRAQTE